MQTGHDIEMSPWVRVEGKLSVSGPKQINPDRRTLEQQCGALPSLGPAAVDLVK